MSNKFTEKQYNMLVEIQEDQYSDDLFFESKSYENSIAYTVAQKYDVLKWFIDTNDLGNEVVALMNPLTREWAHEKFVEKEKKYVWRLKNNNYYRLTNHGGSTQVNISHSSESLLTESEIKAWGYNPEMFDREEV